MAKPVKKSSSTFNKLSRGATTNTAVAAELEIKTIQVLVLELDDVLFHLNSAVLMPERPRGQSASHGSGSPAQDQDKVSGVKALALALKQFQIDPQRRLLLAGHTDTSGDARSNFELSDQRARNVLFLLEGKRDGWAEISAMRHQIENYQQIMTCAFEQRGWACDPRGISNAWNPDTDRATEGFIKAYNAWLASPPHPADRLPLPDGPGGPLARIRADSNHKWPREMWLAVFDLYEDDLAKALGVDPGKLNSQHRAGLKFVDSNRKYLACGESYPIEAADKPNYRSQTNRRVELYFFDEGELPSLSCPPPGTEAHKAPDCPMWHRLHLKREKIFPEDLTNIEYHLRFVFFDRVRQQWADAPEGLDIKAWEVNTASGPAPREIVPTVVKYSGGTYTVKVEDVVAPTRSSIFFTFEPKETPGSAAEATPAHPRYYVFTDRAAAASPSVIRLMSEDTVKALPFADRLQYYDLPATWSSRNYFTRTEYSADRNKGDRFEKAVKDLRQLKPHGGNSTTAAAPLVFSLDDIVLVTSSRSQDIKDKNAVGTAFAAATPLDDNSRFTLFHVDAATTEGPANKVMMRLRIFDPDPDQPVFTNVKFKTNLITNTPGNARLVYFCNEFYDVFDKRTSGADPGFSFAANHLLGARAALRGDPDIHQSYHVKAGEAADRDRGMALTPAIAAIGNYQLHYLHNCAVFDGKPLAYLLVYWNCRFQLLALGGGVKESTAADITNHRKEGMTNAMKRLNKEYLYELSSGTADFRIRPMHFIEAKSDANGGEHLCMVDIVGNYPNSRAWMTPDKGQFRTMDYKPDATYRGNPDPDNNKEDTDGSKYEMLTNHHEMGHATGNPDEYLYDFDPFVTNPGPPPKVEKRVWRGLPKYNQLFTAEGGPYSVDNLSRMKYNRTTRLKDHWKFVTWLHTASTSDDPTKPEGALSRFMKANRWKITFPAKTYTHEFELDDTYRNIFLPAYRGADHQLGAANSPAYVDLLLYKLGDDETARTIKAGTLFKGILAVKTKFALRFRDDGANVWTFNDKLNWARGLVTQAQSDLNLKFRLHCGGANAFDEIYVHFVPHFAVYGEPDVTPPAPNAPADSHANVEITFRIGHAVAVNSKTISCDWGDSLAARPDQWRSVLRRVFGYNDSSAFAKTHFGSIVQWVNQRDFATPANPFTMEDL